MPDLRVHLTGDWPAARLALVRDRAVGCDLSAGDEPPADTQVYVGNTDAETVEKLTDLRHVLIPWAGPGEGIRNAIKATDGRVTLHNLHDNAGATAEQALALLFAACRFVPTMDAKLRAGHWPGRQGDEDLLRQMTVLENSTAVVLGYGSIGRRIGRVLEALDVTVTGVTRSGRDGTTKIDDLHDVLPKAEILVSALPGTDATEGLIGERELSLLPANAVVVNIGRGSAFVEKALFDACKSGRVRAAGLDVWWRYLKAGEATTPPGELPWHELENVVMSPHIGGAHLSDKRRHDRALAIGDLLAALARGEQVNVVDLDAGY